MASAVRHRCTVAQIAVPPAPMAKLISAGISPTTPASSTSAAVTGTARNTSQSARVRGRAMEDAATAGGSPAYLVGEGWVRRCRGSMHPHRKTTLSRTGYGLQYLLGAPVHLVCDRFSAVCHRVLRWFAIVISAPTGGPGAGSGPVYEDVRCEREARAALP